MGKFNLFAIGCFETPGDAEQFGIWGATIGSLAGDTDTGKYMRADKKLYTLPQDLSSNDNYAFSFLSATTSTYNTGKGRIANDLAGAADGQRPQFVGNPYVGEFNLDTDAYEKHIGYRLKQVVGDTQPNGYATVGMLESSLDEDGYPQYKESVMTWTVNLPSKKT